MNSPVVKRSIVIAGHKTSVSLEDAFWKGLKDIAAARDTTLSDLVGTIDSTRRRGNLSSAIRLFVLDHVQAQRDGRGGAERGGAKHDGSAQERAVMVLAPGATPSAVLRPE
jgi:predicted DNA-binding ribbon-helix-helix protein